MTAPKRENSVHVRLCDQADAMLDLICEANSKEKTVMAAELLTKILLGEGHALKVAAERFVRAGLRGIERDQA